MCQFVSIKPSCGCLMNRRTDSDSCLEWDWWAHSGKNGTQWNKCGLLSSAHCAAQQTAECCEDMRAGPDFEWQTWWCVVVSLTNRTLTRPDAGVTLIFLFSFFNFIGVRLQYLISSDGCAAWLQPAPWSDGSLAGTEKVKSHRSDGRQGKISKPFNERYISNSHFSDTWPCALSKLVIDFSAVSYLLPGRFFWSLLLLLCLHDKIVLGPLHCSTVL